MTARARRTAVALALLCAALPAATAAAQEPPPLLGVGGLPPLLTQPPLLTPWERGTEYACLRELTA
jgi:ABC-type sugar transport system substrate-binding protein